MSHFKVNFKMRSYLTPNLDRLANEGILFTNLYATGTRTVRGLEALTLSVPPTPGQSIVWRPKNTNLFTSGALCRSRGHDVGYIYGGDAMFDNMRTCFSRNNYRVIDIVADHCHGSAGRMELDVTKYHIPAIIWNPQLIRPRIYDHLCSQIDIVPTLFGLMNWSYTTRPFGQDVFSPGYTPEEERIYVSNYQKIAYITQGEFAMLKPKQEFTIGKVDLKAGTITPDKSELSKHQLEDTISLYQSASWLFRNGHLGAETAMP